MVPAATSVLHVLLIWCWVFTNAAAAEPPHFRPSRSEPAYLIERDEIEFEFGVLAARSRADGRELRSTSAPGELRMGFADGWLVQVGLEGFTRRRESSGEQAQGLGSSSIAIRHTLPVSETLWASVLVGSSLATAHSSFGNERSAPFLQTALTWYGKKLRLSAVSEYSRSEVFDEFENGTPSAVASATLASFYDLDDRFGLAADFNFDHIRGRGIQRSVIAGLVWRATSRLLFDVGVGGGQGILGSQRLLTVGTIIYF
jgi:hypothetical protein